ncbi:hypothetical protein OsI_05906 [Oryza sativa Indica Group]|uniref:RNase H type-1 domain-containing protein n=1 Tax=Oryza sativa subsp. indica TaxID=39946 RepID=B8AI82_ORYSI|nr:hypothetical protein OsI_05906 [Oryza sativa Indica Group]
MSIATLTTNYMLSNKKGKTKIQNGWKKPPEGMLMINVDAAFDIDSGSGGTGVVLRDHLGACVTASQAFLPYVLDAPTMAEAFALRDGLALAQHIGAKNVIVQTDCMQVVSTMMDGGFSATAAMSVFDDCKLMWDGFGTISIEHCNRNSNQVAHELARFQFTSFYLLEQTVPTEVH